MTDFGVGDEAEVYLRGHDIGAAMVQQLADLILSWGPILQEVGAAGGDVDGVTSKLAAVFRSAASTWDGRPPG